MAHERVRLSIDTWIKLSLILGAWIIGGTVGWVTLQARVNANAEDLVEACESFKEYKDKYSEVNNKQNNDILVLQGDVKYIKETVDKSDDKLEQILRELRGK